MINKIALDHQFIIHFAVPSTGIRVCLCILNLLYDLPVVFFNHCLTHFPSGGFCGFFARTSAFWLVIILVLADSDYSQGLIPYQAKANVLTGYCFFLVQAYFFFNISSFRWPSSSFSASSFLSVAFSFSSRLISFRCSGVIP